MPSVLAALLLLLALPAIATPDCKSTLLGTLVSDTPHPTFLANLSGDTPAYLGDHVVKNQIVVPGAAFLTNTLHAAKLEPGSGKRVVLTNFHIRDPLPLGQIGSSAEKVLKTSTVCTRRWTQIQCTSATLDGRQILHSDARRKFVSDPITVPPGARLDSSQNAEVVRPAEIYSMMKDVGLIYGPAFRRLETAVVQGRRAWTQIRLHEDIELQAEAPPHATLMDASLHLLGAFREDSENDASGTQLGLPFYFDEVIWDTEAASTRSYHVSVALGKIKSDAFDYDLVMWNEEGQPVLTISTGRIARIEADRILLE